MSSQGLRGSPAKDVDWGSVAEDSEVPTASHGVKYRPEDGALIVLYGEDELRTSGLDLGRSC